jgi:cephalosporin hydroxylase
MTAVASYLSGIAEQRVQGQDGKRLAFQIDTAIDSKLLISVAPRGYLHRVPGE